jgi:hypothetical protein
VAIFGDLRLMTGLRPLVGAIDEGTGEAPEVLPWNAGTLQVELGDCIGVLLHSGPGPWNEWLVNFSCTQCLAE